MWPARHSQAEVLATGVPGGLMDQMASLFGVADHALLLDCRSLVGHARRAPRLPRGPRRPLRGRPHPRRERVRGTAGGLRAAPRTSSASLRCATRRSTRSTTTRSHATSSPRTSGCSTSRGALAEADVNALGPLLLASHASLRDDYAVSTPELDLLVDLLVEHGAIGARLTGAGFGGCVVALVQRNHADDCAAKTVGRVRRAHRAARRMRSSSAPSTARGRSTAHRPRRRR